MTRDALATFNPDATLSVIERAYVVRAFERELWSHLTANRWVSLLGPRKYGKSSALMRIREQLLHGGYACAFVDLQSYGRSNKSDYATFLEWLSDTIARELGTSFSPPRKRLRTGLEAWLTEVLSPEFTNMAVVIDEASGVPTKFRTTFFSQLRAFFNLRGRDDTPAGKLASRVVFAFAGTFRPDRMIASENSPFNVSEPITPDDLTRDEVLKLATLGLDADAEIYAERAFSETLGQPYYVQHLLAAVQRAGHDSSDRAAGFQAALDKLKNGADGHLEHLTGLVQADPELRKLVPKVLARGTPFRVGDQVHKYAIISGIARNEGGHLVARNPIYALALEQFAEEGGGSSRFP